MKMPGLVVCGYNRPDNLAKVLKSPALELFPSILISLDVDKDLSRRKNLAKTYKDIVSGSKYSQKITISSANEHLGLYTGMRSNIDLAFEKFETCVILEEDCVPSRHLLRFIEEICVEHQNLILESHICLSRHVKRNDVSGSLTTTKYPFIWGWLTSREVWVKSRIEMNELNRDDVVMALKKVPGSNENFQKHWLQMFDACSLVASARKAETLETLDLNDRFIAWTLNSWATPYTLAYWTQNLGKLAIRPHSNFIQNVGFDMRASHTFRRPRHARRVDRFSIRTSDRRPISMPKFDRWEDQEIFGIETNDLKGEKE